MKTILLLVGLYAVCFAQTSTTAPEPGVSPPNPPKGSVYAVVRDPSTLSYMVEYTTEEPCYECGVRLAVICADLNGCGQPTRLTPHTQNFKTLPEAMRFLNDGMVVNERVGLPYEWTKQFIRLVEVREIPVKVVTSEKDVPQPPIKVETKQYLIR